MKNLIQFPPKFHTAALIVGLIFGSVLLSSGCEKENIDPDVNSEDTFKDPNDNMPSCWTMLDNMKMKLHPFDILFGRLPLPISCDHCSGSRLICQSKDMHG